MIEVEVRGRLTAAEYDALKETLRTRGEHTKHLEREMYLLRGYPGYTPSSAGRDVDIRLRNTSGECEIMLKRKAADGNVGREEVQLKLQDTDLENAKRIVSALGYTTAVKMERTMDQYTYAGIDWQVVATPKGLWYYEAELGVEREDQVGEAEERLSKAARELGLHVMSHEELDAFIDILTREVNVEVEL